MINEFINLDFLKPEETKVVSESVIDIDALSLNITEESAIFLSMLEEESTPEEFLKIVTESAQEFELYNLIDSSAKALESVKNIVKLNKLANFSKIEKRTAIRLGEKANDQLYEKYSKFRKLMIEYRLKLFAKYGNKAKIEARKSIANVKRKVSSMSHNTNIVDKIDKQIAKHTD
jgi:hypothetical protein